MIFLGQHASLSFPGIKKEFADLRSRTADCIEFIQQYGGADLEKTVLEIHHGDDEPADAPIRHNLVMPDWDFEECYKQNKLVLE